MVRVLFVCMGNICRSPTAEGVFSSLLSEHNLDEKVFVDSAGTHAYHIGSSPDNRSEQVALRRGIDISRQRARQVVEDDFVNFDYIVVMDQDNLNNLNAIVPAEFRSKLTLFMDYAPHLSVTAVPDPYYGGKRGFESVLDLVEEASEGLIKHIKSKLSNCS